jgi:hypothetical protein
MDGTEIHGLDTKEALIIEISKRNIGTIKLKNWDLNII